MEFLRNRGSVGGRACPKSNCDGRANDAEAEVAAGMAAIENARPSGRISEGTVGTPTGLSAPRSADDAGGQQCGAASVTVPFSSEGLLQQHDTLFTGPIPHPLVQYGRAKAGTAIRSTMTTTIAFFIISIIYPAPPNATSRSDFFPTIFR